MGQLKRRIETVGKGKKRIKKEKSRKVSYGEQENFLKIISYAQYCNI
jgi:hypothetical protein